MSIKPSFLSQLAQNANSKPGEQKLPKFILNAFPQQKISDHFLSDLYASQGLDRMMKILLYGFYAMNGGAISPINPDEPFWAPRPGMIPEYNIYKFLGKEVKLKPKNADKSFQALRAFLGQVDEDFLIVEKKVEMQNALAKHALIESKDKDEYLEPDRETMRELVDFLLVWADKGDFETTVLLSRAAKQALDLILELDPFGLTKGLSGLNIQEADPNNFRYFHENMGMEELKAIISVFNCINPETKAQPLTLEPLNNGYKLIFDHDETDKFIIIKNTKGKSVVRMGLEITLM